MSKQFNIHQRRQRCVSVCHLMCMIWVNYGFAEFWCSSSSEESGKSKRANARKRVENVCVCRIVMQSLMSICACPTVHNQNFRAQITNWIHTQVLLNAHMIKCKYKCMEMEMLMVEHFWQKFLSSTEWIRTRERPNHFSPIFLSSCLFAVCLVCLCVCVCVQCASAMYIISISFTKCEQIWMASVPVCLLTDWYPPTCFCVYILRHRLLHVLATCVHKFEYQM